MQTDESKLSNTARTALKWLRQCSLTELCAIEMFHFRLAEQHVAKRTADECVKRIAADLGCANLSSPADPIGAGMIDGAPPPECLDLHAEVDEDGDMILEATPLQEPEVKWEAGDKGFGPAE